MLEQIANNPMLATIALSVLIMAFREMWGFAASTGKREWERIEKALAVLSEKTQTHAGSIASTAERLNAITKDHGALDQRQHQLAGKIDGLQQFWRAEFDKLHQEIRAELKDTTKQLRDELGAHREAQRGRHDDLLVQLRQQNTELMHEVAMLIEGLKK